MEINDSVQLEKAILEDTLVELLYGRYKNLVFHRGTAIWRCYSGNRFSRDIDFYLKAAGSKGREALYKDLDNFLKEKGFVVKEKGYENSIQTMHFLVESNVKMKIDINLRYKKGIPVDYRKTDESRIIVLSLSPEQLLNEKIAAYNDKLDNEGRTKHPEVQDLYDMYHLTSINPKGSRQTAKKLGKLAKRIKDNPPPNIRSLGHLIISGIPPSFEMMLDKLKRWSDDNS